MSTFLKKWLAAGKATHNKQANAEEVLADGRRQFGEIWMGLGIFRDRVELIDIALDEASISRVALKWGQAKIASFVAGQAESEDFVTAAANILQPAGAIAVQQTMEMMEMDAETVARCIASMKQQVRDWLADFGKTHEGN
jgi:hypothetical protein